MNILRAIMGMINNKPYYEVSHYSIIFLLVGCGVLLGIVCVQAQAIFGLHKKRKACHKYGRHISYRALPDQRYLVSQLYCQAEEDGNDTLMDLCTKKEKDMISGKFYYNQYTKLKLRSPKRAKSYLYEAACKDYRSSRKQYIRVAERQRNYDHLTRFYYENALKGDGKSAWKLHRLYEDGHAAPQDIAPKDYPHESALFLFIAAEQGVKEAAAKYASFTRELSTLSRQLQFSSYYASYPSDDFENRQRCAIYAAAYGSEQHMRYAGIFFGLDDAPRTNPQLAFLFLRASANRGNTRSLAQLGQMYLDGKGTEKDPWHAMKCFEQAADQGFGPACMSAALYYHNKKEDRLSAAKWLRRGIELGDPECMYNYATLYMTKGYANTPKDPRLQDALVRTAAKFGLMSAQRERIRTHNEQFTKTCFDELDVDMRIRLEGEEYTIQALSAETMPYSIPEIPALRQVPAVKLVLTSRATRDDVTMYIPNTATLPRAYTIL